MHRLTAAFVVTVACNGAAPAGHEKPVAPIGEPPVPKTAEPPLSAEPGVRGVPAGPEPTSAPSATAPKPGTQISPRDAEGRTIMLAYDSDDRCFVYLPFPPLPAGQHRHPGAKPPSADVECPPEMTSPAYRTCRGGVLRHAAEGCDCFVHGNPPRISPNACP